MKHYLTAQRLVLTLALLACSICFYSFRQNDTTEQKTFRKEGASTTDDTITRRKRNRDGFEYRVNDLDNTMRYLDEQMMKLDEQMKRIDFGKMEKEINAVAKIDHEKIAKEVEASIAKVDWKKMQAEIEASADKVRNIDMTKMKLNLEKMKTDLSKQKVEVKINGEKLKTNVSKALENAKGSIEKAKVEIEQLKEFTNELQKDGLIDKKQEYKIEIKNGELYINDKKQSKEVSDKYRKYYYKNNYTISSGGDDNKRVVI